MNIDDSIQYLKGVGPKMSVYLNKLNIRTVRDLLYYPPLRYINRTVQDEIFVGENTTIMGKIIDTNSFYTRNRKFVFIAIIQFGSDYIYAKWFNNKYIMNYIKKDEIVVLSGKINYFKGMYELLHPDYEVLDKEDKELIHTGRIVPIYSLVKGLSQKYIRKIIYNAIINYIDTLKEDLPIDIIRKYNFPDIKTTLTNLHFPENEAIIMQVKNRLKYSELLIAGLIIAIRRKRNKTLKEHTYTQNGELRKLLLKTLDFELTLDQKKAINDIINDMNAMYPMNRLLMGDVGSGKTIIAVLAMLYAIENGYQSALMVPTSVLAQQHYLKIKELLKDLPVKITLLTSSMKKRKIEEEKIKKGNMDIIIGTHALIEDKIIFKNLKMIVIDEQHRFGVVQRNRLRTKANNPDYLIMTATPIPRSMSMVLYGDMNISKIEQKPVNRKSIKTKWLHERDILKMYDFVKKHLREDERAFIVCPVIDEDNKIQLESIEKTFKEISKKYLSEFRCGIIHSRLSAQEKDRVMHELKTGDIQVLIGTTVIEVGIDISNATIMIILNAERFGLSQLHQLRGRVGRGEKQSYCFVVSGYGITEQAKKRLKAFVSTDNGFEIAEMDLKIRGPGEMWGKKQHGIPDFQYAVLPQDYSILKKAFNDANNILKKDFSLIRMDNRNLKNILKRRMEDELKEI